MSKNTMTNEMNVATIEAVSVEKIFPHPNNPRKDLGDLAELAESIKTKGVMQNLTLVPHPGAETDETLADCYMAVIGHRRHAAAKLAGLQYVPCVISNMDEREQVATMLLENIQRSDLTLYEEAEGFQMMFDMGETVDTIASKTGLSTTTVRRRTKLLDLDRDKFAESVARGGTLEDFAKLDKIKDPDTKNEVLELVGTDNFNNALKNALVIQERETLKREITEQLAKFAERVETVDQSKMQYKESWYVQNEMEVPTIEVPEANELVAYYYIVNSYSITLYQERQVEISTETQAQGPTGTPTEREETEEERIAREDREEKERKKREDEAARAEITQRTYQLREDFVRGYTGPKKNNPILQEMLLRMFLDDDFWFEDDTLKDLLGVEVTAEEEENGQAFDIIHSAFTKNLEKGLLSLLYSAWGDSKRNGFFDYWGEYEPNDALSLLYEYLVRLGYKMSDEEKTLVDGTHELFLKPEEEDPDDTEEAEDGEA